ncbi:hypothetical protein HGRIS_006519 [Hohenbuehelia grisea]|uniref:Uncharacterized protein n=1 Tax=Hohenbuehelia grisea TaxID=104357 RepID=A0ABR3J993_9AGAR
MNRWEKRTKGSDGYGCGLNFEKKSTEHDPGCEESTGHYRIIRYDMNGMDILVRFDVNACMISPTSVSSPTSQASLLIDDFTERLANVSINTNAPSTPSTTSYPTVQRGGSWSVDQSSIMELATRSTSNVQYFSWEEAYPQLWLSQIQHHFMAIHYRGMFSTVRKERLNSARMQSVDAQAQWGFKRLRQVLEDIQTLVVGHGETGRLSLVCEMGVLKVYERENTDSGLADEAMRLFDA